MDRCNTCKHEKKMPGIVSFGCTNNSARFEGFHTLRRADEECPYKKEAPKAKRAKSN